MEKRLSVNEYDLLNFFETNPTQLDADVPWIYNDSTYEASDGHVQISFAIAPSVNDVRVLLRSDGVPLYELKAIGVEDVRLHNDKGIESLEIIVPARDSIWIKIKPTISINQQSSART